MMLEWRESEVEGEIERVRVRGREREGGEVVWVRGRQTDGRRRHTQASRRTVIIRY